jgi:hypothetical protein
MASRPTHRNETQGARREKLALSLPKGRRPRPEKELDSRPSASSGQAFRENDLAFDGARIAGDRYP